MFFYLHFKTRTLKFSRVVRRLLSLLLLGCVLVWLCVCSSREKDLLCVAVFFNHVHATAKMCACSWCVCVCVCMCVYSISFLLFLFSFFYFPSFTTTSIPFLFRRALLWCSRCCLGCCCCYRGAWCWHWLRPRLQLQQRVSHFCCSILSLQVSFFNYVFAVKNLNLFFMLVCVLFVPVFSLMRW